MLALVMRLGGQSSYSLAGVEWDYFYGQLTEGWGTYLDATTGIVTDAFVAPGNPLCSTSWAA